MMKKLKMLIVLALVAAFLFGCVSLPPMPTGQTTPPVPTVPENTTPSETETTGTTQDTEPTTTQPDTTPTETQPEVTEPVESQPAATEPVATEPASTEPTTTEPAPTEPAPTDPTECTHDYKIQTVEATCTAGGYTDHSCALCGHSYREETGAKGHSYSAWNTTAATCTKNGSRTRICSGCGDQQTETLAAAGHAYDSGTVLKEAASCSDLGTIRYTCSNCGDSHDTTYQGCHTFGEPYKTMFSGIRIECTECGYFITDFYTWRENSYSDCDKTAALYCDTIKLKESTYTGALSTWSEEWLEWHDLIMDVLRSHGNGGVCLSFSAELDDHGGTEAAFMEEYNIFLDAFEAFYGWRPVMDGEPEVYEDTIYVYFECDKLFPAYESGTKALSSSKKNAIVEDLIAFHVHRMGLRDGMQAYNSMGAICDYMYYKLLSYDYNYRYNSAFRGLTSGITMCQGYSEIFQLFAEYCGLSCEIVEGTMMGEAHAWNRVTFSDGTQRYVDVTNLGYDYYILVPWSAMTHSHKLKD